MNDLTMRIIEIFSIHIQIVKQRFCLYRLNGLFFIGLFLLLFIF